MNAAEPEYNDQVLSTMNRDGSRRWLRPRVSPGRFLNARRWVGYALILIFILMPYLHLNGKPLVFLNLADREFTFFGFTFLPTDTLLLAFFIVGFVVSLFLVTALLGRIWCGWMCPQLVYLELVYRPIEYLFEGKPKVNHAIGRHATPARIIAKYIVYFIISFLLAHVFLAYFVGVDSLWQWVRESPFSHPLSFFAVLFVTGLMMFDFCFFREQTCVLACPYGRFQSVMLDRDSLIICYDEQRGEPRGKLQKNVKPGETKHGDCIDCHLCVDTCPTGIDIRNGLQLECVACAQCIDACDNVMEKINKPRGLIRYSSQAAIADGKSSIVRPRVIAYPLILLVIATAFGITLAGKQDIEAKLLRPQGRPFFERSPGEIANQARLRITNRSDSDTTFTVAIASDIIGSIEAEQDTLAVPAGESRTFGLLIKTPRDVFNNGRRDIELEIRAQDDTVTIATYRLIGPRSFAKPTENSNE